MSTQLDGYESPVSTKVKKIKAKDPNRREKKRKRSEQHSGQTSPTKKLRSKLLAQDSRPTDVPPQVYETADTSPFFEETTSFYVPLSPICQPYPLQGVCAEHLSPLILTYYPPLTGVVLSYSNPKLSSRAPGGRVDAEDEEEPVLAQNVNEYAVSFVWVTADFLVFRPQRGCRIEGWINLQNEGNIGLVCFNFFSATIERSRLPKDWKWIRGGTGRLGARRTRHPDDSQDQEETSQMNGFGDEEGHFVDGRGERVHGSLTFTVKGMEASRVSDREHAFISIEGTMLSATEEKELREQDFMRSQSSTARKLFAGRGTDYAMTGALSNGHVDGLASVHSAAMRLQLTVQRQSIPPVKVLWTVNATRPTSNAPGASFTISQFLEQVNEVIPLEADEWGLEDYAVEVRGFECLHFSELILVLKEDDEVCIRPLQTSDLRFRRISGRHQITSDGRHLIDGVAFGRPFLRRTERPALRIPPRKRRRVTYDAEDDDDSGDIFNDCQVMAPPSSAEASDINALADDDDNDEEDEEDDDFVVGEDEEQDLSTEILEIEEDRWKMADEIGGGALAITNGAGDGAAGADKSRRVTRSQRLGGLGLQGPALLELVDENGRPYPGAYNNPLLDFYSQEDASVAQASPRRKRRKTNGMIEAPEPTPPGQSTSGALAPQRRRESSASLKNVRFQDGPLVTPPTTILDPEDSEDTEDEDFELSADEDGEVDESDKENAEPRFGEISSDNMSSERDSSSSYSSEHDSDSDESTSSSGSSSSSSSSSDTGMNKSPASSSRPQEDDEETSSSGSSSDSSISESEHEVHSSTKKQSSPRSKVAGSKANAINATSDFRQVQAPPSKTEANQTGKKIPFERVLDIEQAVSPQSSTPPRQGSHSTRRRRKRRQMKVLFDRLKSSGEYDDDAAIREAVDNRFNGKDSTANTEGVTKTTDRHTNQADDQFEAKKKALLESIASGGVEISTPEVETNSGRNERLGLMTVNNKPREASSIPASESPAQKAIETPGKAQQNTDESPSTLLADSAQTDAQHGKVIDEMPATAVPAKPTSTEQSTADGPPSAKPSRPRAKVDLASSRRLLFGALGLRTPKTKEDEKALQAKLMQDIRPVKNVAVEAETVAEEVPLGGDVDDESWRDKIKLRAVECCHEGIQLSTPPFPFVQRWDPQQQRGNKAGNGKNSNRNKKRKRKHQQEDYEGIEEQWIGPPPKHQKFDAPAEAKDFSTYQIGEPEDSRMQDDAISADNHTTHDLGAPSDANGDYEEDLPKLPEDLASCETLTKDSSIPGTVVAFKMLDMSQETNWQPRISKYRTALINDFLEDGMLRMTLAHRDRSNQKVTYHSETGERLYDKFEMPGYESQEEGASGHLMVSFAELIEPKVIRLAKPKESEEQEKAVEASVEGQMAVDTVDDNLNTAEPAETSDAVQNSRDINDEDADESWEGIEDTAVADDTEMTETTDVTNPLGEDESDQVKYPDLPVDTDMVEMADTEDQPASSQPQSQFKGGDPASQQSKPQSVKNVNEEVREEIFNLIRDAGWRSSLNPEVDEKQMVQSEATPRNGNTIAEVHVPSSPPTSPGPSGVDMDSGLNGESDGEELPAEIAETCQGPSEVPDSITEPAANHSDPPQGSIPAHDIIDEWAPEAMDDEDSALWDTQANQQIASERMSSHASTPKPPKSKLSPHKRHSRTVKSISPSRLPRSKISPRISSTAPESKGIVNGSKTDGRKSGTLLDSGSSSDELPSLEQVFAARIASLDHPSSSIPPRNNNNRGSSQSINNANEEIKSEDSIFDISALPNHSTQTPSTQNTQKLHTQKRALRSPPVDDPSLRYISDDASGFVLGSQIPKGSQIIDLTLSSDPVEPSDSAYEGDSSLPTGPGWMNKVRRGTRERSVGRGCKKGFRIHSR